MCLAGILEVLGKVRRKLRANTRKTFGDKSDTAWFQRSGKFAHYTPANTGYEVVYGSLADCVNSALTGRVTRDERLWS